VHVFAGHLNQALRADVDQLNQRQLKKRFICMSMRLEGWSNRTYVMPAKAAGAMQLEIACESPLIRR